jgi:hypothetical protein
MIGFFSAAAIVIILSERPATFAQERQMEAVTVTAMSIDDDDRRAPSAIYRRVQADVFQVEVSATSGSRDHSERALVLEAMFNKL